jgi:hypothetical protein
MYIQLITMHTKKLHKDENAVWTHSQELRQEQEQEFLNNKFISQKTHYISELVCTVYILYFKGYIKTYQNISWKNRCSGVYEYTTLGWCNNSELNAIINTSVTCISVVFKVIIDDTATISTIIVIPHVRVNIQSNNRCMAKVMRKLSSFSRIKLHQSDWD